MKHRISLCIVGLLLTGSCGRDASRPGTTDSASSAIQITIASVEVQGTQLRIEWTSSKPIQNIWYPACGTAPRLFKTALDAWSELQDARPREGTFQPYYLDGTYVENQSLGCDGGNSCYEGTGAIMSTLEYLQIGTRAPQAPYLAVGSTGPSEAPVPDIVTRATTGPYQLELRYMIGGCPSAEIGVARLALPPL